MKRALALALLATLATPSCGGDSGLFTQEAPAADGGDTDAGTGGTAGSDAATGGAAGDGSGGAPMGGTGGAAGAAAAAGSGGTAGAAGVGATGGSGGTGGVAGASATGGSGGDPNEGVVNCGSDVCDLATESCCGQPGGQFQCQPQCTGMSQEINCDGPEDCPGTEVCCGGFGGAECQTQCGPQSIEYCHDNTDCQGQDQCLSCTLPGGFTVDMCADHCPF